ncbi:hypothetical protein AMECASPLE_003194 [Ameca splendens]|uniref:Uncharacterized protein n=1 Tax=Ameca splendens TaxID=208324 RepID=A0ABV0ZI76_9TELE
MKFETIHSFIFYVAYYIVGNGGAGAYLQLFTGERRGKPCTGHKSIAGQHRDIQDKQPCTHSLTPTGNFRETNLPKCHIFGLWEEAGGPGENPRMHGENMQTPCRKSPGRNSQVLLAARQQCYQLTLLFNFPHRTLLTMEHFENRHGFE